MKKVIGIGAVLILLLGMGVRIWAVNSDTKYPEVAAHQIGEEVLIGKNVFLDDSENMRDYAVTVNSAEILTYEEFLEKYDISAEEVEDHGEMLPEMVYDVGLTFRNISTEEGNGGINFVDYKLYGEDFVIQYSSALYAVANPTMGYRAEQFRLRPDTSMEFHLPFDISNSRSPYLEPDELRKEELYLVVSLYPVQNQILIEETKK